VLNRALNQVGAKISAALLFLLGVVKTLTPAHASTAVFTEPATLTASDVAALSTSGDAAGVNLALGEVLALLFDTPFGVSKSDSVSIFTLPPTTGAARLTINFGSYNGGSPVFAATRFVNAGSTLTVGNLFQQGCSAFGGCDYIEIITSRTQRGATGAEIDYVDVNGEVVSVAAPTPEPATWLMMIVGFALVAMRLKAIRFRLDRRTSLIAVPLYPQPLAKTARWRFATRGMRRTPAG
jgi:hypothetical protein